MEKFFWKIRGHGEDTPCPHVLVHSVLCEPLGGAIARAEDGAPRYAQEGPHRRITFNQESLLPAVSLSRYTPDGMEPKSS